jgi:hypothetical protein
MQTWNFRIINHGTHFGLHEVSYRRDGTVHSWSKRPVSLTARADEGPEGIVQLLATALEDARKRPVLTVSGSGVTLDRSAQVQPAPMLAG